MYTDAELKEYAQTIMKNPYSDRSQEVIRLMSVMFKLHPQEVLDKIKELAE